MKLRATITVDFEAEDFRAAAAFEEAIAAAVEMVSRHAPQAGYEIRERRGTRAGQRRKGVPHSTGKLLNV